MHKNAVVLNIFVLLIIQHGFCMDEPDPKKPGIYPQLSSSNGISGSMPIPLSSSSGSLVGSLANSPAQSWFSFNPVTSFFNMACSLKETAETSTCFSSMLRKVAYPLNAPGSAEELRLCNKTYTILETLQEREQLREALERCCRRTGYLTEIALKLNSCPDSRAIALHVVAYQKRAMNKGLDRFFPAHLHAENKASAAAIKEIEQQTQGQVDLNGIPCSADSPGQTVITLPTTFGTVGNYLLDCASSLYQTTKLKNSDVEVIQKLDNPEQLKTDLEKYAQELPLNQPKELDELLRFYLRRTEFMVRIFLYLPTLPPMERARVAAFCVKHHRPAMFPLLYDLFIKDMRKENEETQQASAWVIKNSNLNVISEENIMQYFGKIDEQPNAIQQSLGLNNIILLKQIHGTTGCVITEDNCTMQMGEVEGDFLVTNCKNIGLGVSTADCLPIVFVDQKHNVVGIAHAGWRGSIANIAKEVLDCMNQKYGTQSADVAISFGPCAQKCCYEVGNDFVSQIDEQQFPFVKETIVQRSDKFFFDLLRFNRTILISLGVPEAEITSQYSKCTICNHEYNSYRRDGDQAGRQISCIWVK